MKYYIHQENERSGEQIEGRLGEINTNTYGTPMKIVAYRNWDDIDIEFLDDFHYIKEHQTYSNFKNGGVRNPYDRTVFGVGYAGVGDYLLTDVKPTKAYMIWYQLMNRCYNPKEAKNRKSYYGIVTICPEWHNFQNFAKWYTENYYEVEGRIHVDKDILFPDNKEYHPDKCLLVPQRINEMFRTKKNKHGLPTGIGRNGNSNRYRARYNGKELGTFDTLEEAVAKHTEAKRKHIREVAEEYKSIIPTKVYDALMNW